MPTLLLFSITLSAYGIDKGIYLTQYMLENPEKLNYLIREAKASGLNTFVVDHEYFSSKYAPAVAKVKAAGLKVVTRVVVFSNGGNAKQIKSQEHWEKIYKLIDDAINAGSDVIQLDYIRYSSKEPANPEHAKDVHKVIKWFKAKINSRNVPMEIDIFGEVSYHPSLHIGQDLKLFADSVDGMNPMVYPSHFWPYQKYSADPYKTVNDSLNALLGHFDNKPPFKVHAFIEAANYHYIKKTSNAEKQKYLLHQIRAVEDAKGVSGWYVWSANNVYENLFHVLKTTYKTMPASNSQPTKINDKKTAITNNKNIENKKINDTNNTKIAIENNNKKSKVTNTKEVTKNNNNNDKTKISDSKTVTTDGKTDENNKKTILQTIMQKMKNLSFVKMFIHQERIEQ
jgi:hypothetical protein